MLNALNNLKASFYNKQLIVKKNKQKKGLVAKIHFLSWTWAVVTGITEKSLCMIFDTRT